MAQRGANEAQGPDARLRVAPARSRPLLERVLPGLHWARRYERRDLGRDPWAGTLEALVVISSALGAATLAGLPPQAGLLALLARWSERAPAP